MKIAIIGGGIAGLTTALCLHKVGLKDVTVYEQSDVLNEIGAGILLQPNAIRIMNWLGLTDEIKRSGLGLNKVEITDAMLNPFNKMKREVVQDDYGNQIVAIHRGKFQRILFDRFSEIGKVKLGMKFTSLEEGNGSAIINFGEHKEVADLIIGADGINSKVRACMFSNTTLRDSGQICWRGVSNYNLPEKYKDKASEAWGLGRRFGFCELDSNSVYWYAVIDRNGKVEGLNKEELAKSYDKYDPLVSTLILNADKIHKAQLKDLKRLPKWHKGITCLIGDAAHAATPNMGQGACQGIEDAYYISQYLRLSEDVSKAFRQFEDKRRPKVDHIVNTSWKLGKAAHSSFGQFFMKMMLKVTPEHIMIKQMQKVFEVEMMKENIETDTLEFSHPV